MRPSQYHYIKCVVTRTAYNRKMQKKRAKKRERTEKSANGFILFKKKRKHFCHFEPPGFKMFALASSEY